MSLRQQSEAAAARAADDPRALDVDLNGEQAGIELSEWAPLAGQLADWATTRAALDDHHAREGNPLMVRVVQNGVAFLAVKAGAGWLGGRVVDRFNDAAGRCERWGLHEQAARERRKARLASLGLTLLGLAPAINNAIVLAKK